MKNKRAGGFEGKKFVPSKKILIPMMKSLSFIPATSNDQPETTIRLFLRASNLPKSITAHGYCHPDTLARVSFLIPDRQNYNHSDRDADNTEAVFPPLNATHSSGASSREGLTVNEAPHSGREYSQLKSRHEQVMDQTEVSMNNTFNVNDFCKAVQPEKSVL